MKKLLWSVPAIAIYFYMATVLTEYSFVSYFGIPPSFVEASLKSNIIYFYEFFVGIESVVGNMRWWIRILGVLIIGLIIFLSYASKYWKGFFTLAGTILLFSFLLFASPRLGTMLAESTTNFLVPSATCPPVGDAPTYIVPVIGNGQGFFVPVDADNKMINSFLVKDLADMPCPLERRNIGKITR